MLNCLPRSSEPAISHDSFLTIAEILKKECGFSLDGYKDSCVKRRIDMRVHATRCASSEAYAEQLTGDPGERQQLLKVLTIHVSHFFRNPSTFHKLSREILPRLIAEREENAPLRLMSVGCAGGEEPYSLAMVLREQFADVLPRETFSILGTDVDAESLEAAQGALYRPERLAEVSPEQLSRWFTREGDRFRLAPEIRSLVGFQRADLNDPPCGDGPCDLIMCRNVLIYFERDRQESILNGFADQMRTGAVLVLGKSESLFGSARRRFRTVCPVERIYIKA